ncbi:hypothetical protein GGI42DRAFT_148384 [Trichoderma sp. SZMC 28013]
MRLALPVIPALPCHEVASAPLFKPMRRHTSAFSLSPAALPRSKTRATGVACQDLITTPIQPRRAVGHDHRPPLPVIEEPFSGRLPISVKVCEPVSASCPAQSWSCSGCSYCTVLHCNLAVESLIEAHHSSSEVLLCLISPRGGILSCRYRCGAHVLVRSARRQPPSKPSSVHIPPSPRTFPGQFSGGPLKRACFVLDTEGKEAFPR